MTSDPARRPNDATVFHSSTRAMASRDPSWNSPILISSSPPAHLPYPMRPHLWNGLSPTVPTLSKPEEERKDLQTRRREKKDARPANADRLGTRPAKRARSMSPTIPVQQPTVHFQQASTHLEVTSPHLQETHKRHETGSLRLATTTQDDEDVEATPEPALSPSYGPADHSFHRRKSGNKSPTTPFQIRKRESPSTLSPTTPNTSDNLPLRDSYVPDEILRNELLRNITSSNHTPSKSTIVSSQRLVHYTEGATSTSAITLQPVPRTALAPRKRSSENKQGSS